MSRLDRSDQFKSALKDVAQFIAKESGNRAIATRFLRRVSDKCEQYARQPEMGELRTDLGEQIRCFTVGNYVVFYRPTKNGILLLAIIHGARDIPVVFRKLFSTIEGGQE